MSKWDTICFLAVALVLCAFAGCEAVQGYARAKYKTPSCEGTPVSAESNGDGK